MSSASGLLDFAGWLACTLHVQFLVHAASPLHTGGKNCHTDFCNTLSALQVMKVPGPQGTVPGGSAAPPPGRTTVGTGQSTARGSVGQVKNRGMDVDVFLALGMFSERIALHNGFELDAFQQSEGIDIAEHWADDGNPVGQASDGPEA